MCMEGGHASAEPDFSPHGGELLELNQVESAHCVRNMRSDPVLNQYLWAIKHFASMVGHMIMMELTRLEALMLT